MPIQDFLEAFFMFFPYKMGYLVVSKKKNPLFVWGWDRKSVPLDLVMPIDDPWISLSHPHTHDEFLKYIV